MDGRSFDSLARTYAAGRSRRSILLGLIAGTGAFAASRTTQAKPAGKVTLCHKPGTPAQKTLIVSANAVNGHLGHGDSLGACSECVEGTLQCSGTGFETCDHGVWVYRACAPGTICVPDDVSGIRCDRP